MPITPDNIGDATSLTAEGSDVTEVTADGNVVWTPPSTAHASWYLDMRDNGDEMDVSGNSLSVSAGTTVLMWVRPTQVGSSSADNHPGLFGGSSGANWDNHFGFRSDDGGAITSGNANTLLRAESTNGDTVASNVISLPIGEWSLIGFGIDSGDSGGVYFFNSNEIGEGFNSWAAGAEIQMNYFGWGYGGEDNNGSGDKDIAYPMVFDEQLSESQVADYYNNQNIPSSIIHEWPLENNANDTTGNADGTITGATFVEEDVP